MEVSHATSLPMREISALGVLSDDEGKPELLAVGDEDSAVVTARYDDDGAPTRTSRHDLFLTLVGTGIDLRGGSGFEGVAADAARRVFVLQEERSRLLVLSADMSKLLHVIALEVPADTAGYGAAWRDDSNARAEGLLLLTSGHVLVAKQMSPVYLIEFGPDGDEPVGVGHGSVLPPDRAFSLPAEETARLVALASWPVRSDDGAAFPTLNDLAIGDDGRVYVISSHGQTIGRLEKRLRPDEQLSFNDFWRIKGLPGGDEARPEGLVMVGDATPVVGIDSKTAADNSFVLDMAG